MHLYKTSTHLTFFVFSTKTFIQQHQLNLLYSSLSHLTRATTWKRRKNSGGVCFSRGSSLTVMIPSPYHQCFLCSSTNKYPVNLSIFFLYENMRTKKAAVLAQETERKTWLVLIEMTTKNFTRLFHHIFILLVVQTHKESFRITCLFIFSLSLYITMH